VQPGREFLDPSEHELRVRAAVRVARRRSFMVSAVVVGSLILLNFYLYARSHDAIFLLLDVLFAGTLSFRAWVAFGSNRRDEDRISREVERMRPLSAQTPSPWQPPAVPHLVVRQPAPVVPQQVPVVPQQVPAVPPPPSWSSQPAAPQVEPTKPADEPPPSSDPWAGSWSF
jgi:hypothetical protein